MQAVKLNNGVEMPILGYGVYQVGIDACKEDSFDFSAEPVISYVLRVR